MDFSVSTCYTKTQAIVFRLLEKSDFTGYFPPTTKGETVEHATKNQNYSFPARSNIHHTLPLAISLISKDKSKFINTSTYNISSQLHPTT